MTRTRTILAAGIVAVGLLGACQPEIGSGCRSDGECGRNQVCDTASPGGYCLEYDCRFNECPPEAVCVDFVAEGDVVVSACMRRCDSDKQCRQRDGYVCRTDGAVPFCGLEPTDP